MRISWVESPEQADLPLGTVPAPREFDRARSGLRQAGGVLEAKRSTKRPWGPGEERPVPPHTALAQTEAPPDHALLESAAAQVQQVFHREHVFLI